MTDEEWSPLEQLAIKMAEALQRSTDLVIIGGSDAIRAHYEYEIAKSEFETALMACGLSAHVSVA